MVLYELSAKGDLRFSPFCWKARMALAHKGLEPEHVPWRSPTGGFAARAPEYSI
jgi:glutathione S-transferase